MYYILFETGNERFFRSITTRFAAEVVRYISDTYASVKQEHTDALDRSTLQSYFKKNGTKLFFFDCGLFVNTNKCAHGCKDADHRTAVLTSHQWRVYDKSMIEAKKRYVANTVFSPLKRAGLQTMFQYHEASKGERCKTIETKNINPRYNRVIYLVRYIGRIKKLGKTNDFTYIRDGTQSDFNTIRKYAGLVNLAACDKF